VGGLDLQELLDVTERWVDEAMNMDESSLKRMERLRSAQARRVASNKTT
jgi:DSF synthase